MASKLIYLHIPKAGGTSQKHIFGEVYGADNVFWLDGARGNEQPPTDLQAAVVGGHRPISFYPPGLDALYCAVVRDPISRIASLFSHYTRPEASADDFASSGRASIQQQWLERGMDPDSIIRSVEHCAAFKEEISNYQCYYLSRYGRDFAGVMRTLDEVEVVVAGVEHLGRFNSLLATRLGWAGIPERRLNVSRQDAHQAILQDEATVQFLSQFVQEDLRLYRYITDHCGGVLERIADPARCLRELAPAAFNQALDDAALVMGNLQLFSKGYAGVRPDGYCSTGIAIVNQNGTEVGLSQYPGTSLYCEILDQDGDSLQALCVDGPLVAGIPAQQSAIRNLELDIEPGIIHRAETLRIGIRLASGEQIADRSPLHATMARLVKVADSPV